jgi:PKD domain
MVIGLWRRRVLIAALACAIVGPGATPASAVLRIAQESAVTAPYFRLPSPAPFVGTNVWYAQWARPAFTPFYQLCYNVYRDGSFVAGPQCTPNLAGQGADNTWQWDALSYPVVRLAQLGVDPDPGHSWHVCGYERYGNPATGEIFQSEALCGNRTLIDAGAPRVALRVNGSAEWRVLSPRTLKLDIDYYDALSPPFPSQEGGATFVCLQPITNGLNVCDLPATHLDTQHYLYVPACSRPAARARITTFSCGYTAPGDGAYKLCVVEADGAYGGVTPSAPAPYASNSNLGRDCRLVTVDSVPPSLTVLVPRIVRRRRAVVLWAGASDNADGPLTDDQITWQFGDRTKPRHGVTVTHRWTRSGRYRVTVRATDHAGNTNVVTRRVRVTSRGLK